MSRPNPYINTFYLAVHLALNILVVALIVNLIGTYIPIKHYFMGYHFNVHNIYTHIDMQKNVAPIVAIGIAVWYYQRRKAKTDSVEKH
ncbi:hypothetical protein [Mucilaginibacter paludis]|uniref:Uncharacterized protein n=1 Tax=Mucilaginibacter paludis DSM 18603 TaxID=714943 RepID=H1YB46_9SPHI|nr:hypothetical protein [Mucilaginibacter paludis]EHQ30572.1 hypothetical protein Mucpa_6519 [Mucilaginibacter paludis DSM 18603]